MFERYTRAARWVIFSSINKASHVGCHEIETEHLLLGLLAADKGLSLRFLGSAWAAETVWKRIEQTKPARDPISSPGDRPLSKALKRVLAYAAAEADGLSSKQIRTEHLLLGLLREEKCLAAEILHEHGIRLASAREQLTREPHNDSATEKFVRERVLLPKDVVEFRDRIRLIVKRLEGAIANRDFTKARAYADEERVERAKLFSLYQQHGLPDWLFE